MSTSDAVAREAAWLATTTDALPVLLSSAGGKWDIIQAYWPGSTLRSMATGIYVQRGKTSDVRVSNQRIRPRYQIRLKLHWPVKITTAPMSATAQQAFDAAIEMLLERIRGPLGDKSHGGRFLSAGEATGGGGVTVDYEDPEVTIPAKKGLLATITYMVDDLEVSD